MSREDKKPPKQKTSRRSIPRQKAPSARSVYSPEVSGQKVPRPEGTKEREWVFSFKYWKQIEYFGLDANNVRLNWFVSLLEQLRELSGKTIHQVMVQPSTAYRFHQIKWEQKNIPISKQDLDWVPSSIRENSELPFYQFQISKALGRVVGYFDDKYVFHIVLLDPEHNAQLSKYDNYQVQGTRILPNEYQKLTKEVAAIHKIAESHCDQDCQVLAEASKSASTDN